MTRFFVDALPAQGSEYRLEGENAAHAKVLRLRPGERVELCDGRGLECECELAPSGALLPGPGRPSAAEPHAAVSVYLAFPKADKLEHVIQKATELGAAEIVAFPSRYCVSRPDEKSLGKKLERWQKIAAAAAGQSHRGRIPAVRALKSFDEALGEAAGKRLGIFFYENERARTLRAALEAAALGPRPDEGGRPELALLTGAEGGFAEEEVARAEAAGLRICTLGPRILRCETAPLAALSAVLYALGEL